MTTVYIDPIHGAALTAGLLPILPGLPCPTCAGRSEFRDDMFGSSPCPDCTDGVWTPPDHPVTIGVTSARVKVGERYGDWMTVKDPDIPGPVHLTPRRKSGEAGGPHPIALSSVIGEATLRALKVVEDIVHAPDVGPAAVDGEPTVFGGLIAETDWPHRLLLTTNRGSLDISSALPFLPGLKPGDTVYLLDGFTESVVCPGERTCRVCPEHQYSEPQDQR